MPIRVRQAPEPFTKDADRQPPLFAPSDAYRRLHSELRRYVRRETGGRSFLISGHRGSGKTTLVLQAIWDIRRSAQSTSFELVPLLVRLRGPDLLPDPELLQPPKDAAKRTAARDLAESAPEVPEGEPDEDPADSAEDDGGEQDAEPPAPPAGRVSPQALAERALRQITIAVYRAASEAFADAFSRRLTEGASTGDGLPGDQLPVAERAELAARFRLALDEAPSPEVLRELYRLGGALDRGVLPAGGPDDARGQGMRELAALASAAAAFRMVSGKVLSSRKETRTASEERSRSFSLDPSTKDLVEKALVLVLGGGVGTAALTAGGQSPAVAGLVGVGAALAAAGVLKFTGNRTRKRTASEVYTFLPDHDASTLERELPVLIDRLADAGLAPVFVVDELDKVGGLQERMRTVVSQLKQFVSERGFFCFLTDRDYFEHLRDRSLREPYPHEHTYFTDQLFVLHRPGDLHEYLDDVLDPGTDGATEQELLRFFLLHRSKMHPVDLRRELRRMSDADDYITLGWSDLGLRFAVMVQLAVEWLLARDPLRSRLEQDPHFAQPVYDALYYLSRTWEQGGEEKGEQTDAGILDLSPAAFRRYLATRMNPNRPPPGASPPGAAPKVGNDAPAVIPLSARDRGFLLEQVRELVSLLREPEQFKERLDVEPLVYLRRPGARKEQHGVEPPANIPTSAARDAIPVEELLLVPLAAGRFAFQFDPYGRRLELPAGAVVQVAEEGAGAAVAGDEERKAEVVAAQNELRRTAGITKEVRSAVNLIRELDRFVYDLVGMNLATLASIHVLSAVPPWAQVEEAIGRLRPCLDGGEPYPALKDDAGVVASFAFELRHRSRLLAASLVYGTALGSAVDAPHETERRTRGLSVLSEGLRFQDRRSPGALQRELERYRVTVSGAYEDHRDWPSLTDVDFGQWQEWVNAAVKSRGASYDPNRVRLASESAWRSWKERLEKRAITGRVEIEVTEADLLCKIAGAPPATELRLDLEEMTLRDWSDAFIRGCGFSPKPPTVAPETNGHLDHRPRAWLAAAALIELGLGERVESFLGSTDFDTKDVEQVRSWLRRIQETRPRGLQARQLGMIVYAGDEPVLSASWLPSKRFGAVSWPSKGPLMVLGSSLRAVTGGHHRPVLLLELPSRKDEVERWRATLSKLRELGLRPNLEFILAPDESQATAFLQAAGAPGLDNEDDWGAPPIAGAQSLDDAMERALRYLKLPT